MIKNERQYAITKAQAERFELALKQLQRRPVARTRVNAPLNKLEEDALRSQLADLRAEIEAYESLRSGKQPVLKIAALEELPRALIQGRIASGLSQKELAVRLGLKEQQIQRYEATEYSSASLTRLVQVSRALNLRVRAEARPSRVGKPGR